MPRPSSPVHAKASTNCPYLTLESPHHQRQRWAFLAEHQLGRAALRQITDVDDYNLSQILVIEVGMGDARSIRPALASQHIRASLVPTDTITASILRTHSQCQRGSLGDPLPMHLCNGTVVFISRFWSSGGAYRDRTDDLMLAKQPLSQLS